MSVSVSDWVWKHSNASGNDLLLLLALADQADDNGLCWPSAAFLAKKTRLSVATIRRRLHTLRDAGVITTEMNDGRVNRYRFSFQPAIDGVLEKTENPSHPEGGSKVTPLSPNEEGPLSPSARGPLSPSDSRTINEPSENRQSRSPASPKFQEFWERYPKKVGKAEAERKFKVACRSNDPDVIIAAVVRMAPTWMITEQRFIPNPSTWLHQGRWEDVPASIAAPSQFVEVNRGW